MPIHDSDPMVEARALYQRMLDDTIVDVPAEGGLFRQHLDFPALVQLVEDEPRLTQILTQTLGRMDAPNEHAAANARLHSTWLMMAMIFAFGEDSNSVKWTRKIVPEIYESAIETLRNDGKG